jgi:hypothetical protein
MRAPWERPSAAHVWQSGSPVPNTQRRCSLPAKRWAWCLWVPMKSSVAVAHLVEEVAQQPHGVVARAGEAAVDEVLDGVVRRPERERGGRRRSADDQRDERVRRHTQAREHDVERAVEHAVGRMRVMVSHRRQAGPAC